MEDVGDLVVVEVKIVVVVVDIDGGGRRKWRWCAFIVMCLGRRGGLPKRGSASRGGEGGG